MPDELRAATTKMLAKHLAAIDQALSEYTIEMRRKDVEIDRLIPHAPRSCFCTGACKPAHSEYQGACVATPHYHLTDALQGIIPTCRIAVTERGKDTNDGR